MRATRRLNRRRVVPALAAVLLLGACGRGGSEQRVRWLTAASSPVPRSPKSPRCLRLSSPPPPDHGRSDDDIGADADHHDIDKGAPSHLDDLHPAKPRAAGDRCASLAATDVPLSAAGGKPTDLAPAPDGAIWFTGTGASAIGRLAPDGTVRMFPLSAGHDASSIAIGPAGDVWFTQYGFYKTAEFGPPPPARAAGHGRIFADGIMTEYPLPTIDSNRAGRADPLSGVLPGGITAGPDGAMWFTEAGADQIGRIGPDGVITEYPLPSRQTEHGHTPVASLPGSRRRPVVQRGARPRRSAGSTPRRRPSLSTPSPRAGSSPMEWGSTGPLVEGPDGAFWFSDWTTTITTVTTHGRGHLVAGVTPPADGIRSMVAGPDGQLWFADQRSPALFRMTRKGVVMQLWIPPGAPKANESLSGMAVASGRVRLGSPSHGRTRSPVSPAAADSRKSPRPGSGPRYRARPMGMQADYVRKLGAAGHGRVAGRPGERGGGGRLRRQGPRPSAEVLDRPGHAGRGRGEGAPGDHRPHLGDARRLRPAEGQPVPRRRRPHRLRRVLRPGRTARPIGSTSSASPPTWSGPRRSSSASSTRPKRPSGSPSEAPTSTAGPSPPAFLEGFTQEVRPRRLREAAREAKSAAVRRHDGGTAGPEWPQRGPRPGRQGQAGGGGAHRQGRAAQQFAPVGVPVLFGLRAGPGGRP